MAKQLDDTLNFLCGISWLKNVKILVEIYILVKVY